MSGQAVVGRESGSVISKVCFNPSAAPAPNACRSSYVIGLPEALERQRHDHDRWRVAVPRRQRNLDAGDALIHFGSGSFLLFLLLSAPADRSFAATTFHSSWRRTAEPMSLYLDLAGARTVGLGRMRGRSCRDALPDKAAASKVS